MKRVAEWFARLALPLVAVVLFVLFALVSRHFLSFSNAGDLLQQTAPIAVATVGQTLVIAAGGLDISIGSVVAFASVVGALAALHFGVLPGFAGFLIAGMAIGSINGWAVAWLGLSPIITTIATLTFAQGAAFLISNGASISGIPGVFAAFAWGTWGGVPAVAWVALAIVAGGHLMLRSTDFGLRLRAVGGGVEYARLAGVRIRAYLFAPYVLSGLTTGVAALMYSGQASSGQPTLGAGLQLTTIAAAVIGGTSIGGGRGSVWGSALGALIIVMLSNGMILAGVTPYIQEIALGFAVIAAVVWDNFRRWLERVAAQRDRTRTPSVGGFQRTG